MWGALPCVVTLAFLPGVTFYYDVIPKAAALLAGAGLACLWAAAHRDSLASIWTSRWGRWNAVLTLAAILLAVVSALTSSLSPLAWMGSEWRRMGAVEVAAMGVAALLAGGHRGAVMRGLCVSGILAASYGCAQYFGWDPWIDPSGYHFGEGAFQIVRPPGPMGHSNYLAAFLLWPVFCAAAVWRENRWLGGMATLTGVVCILLCGSRGALAGLLAGALVLAALQRPRLRTGARAAAIAAIFAGAFYLSPYGERLRARVFWIGEDSAGGSRLPMWRDGLRMGLERPLTGYGLDTFATEFPLHQSADLSRRFPDFYHESPHNLFLDALISHGVPGVLLWLAWIGLGTCAASRTLREPHASALLAGLAAAVVAHQFAVLVIPTAFALLLGLGMLTRFDEPLPRKPLSFAWAVLCVALAALFLFQAQRLIRADAALAQVQHADSATAGELWRATQGSGVSANLYFSRRWTADATRATTAIEKLRWTQIAGEAALAATLDLEQRQNAWYNLAILQAAAGNARGVEQSLRAAIAAAPTWFKPHWTLARLLASLGRAAEARTEARLALDLNGPRDAEVIATMEEILRSPVERK